MSLTWKDLVTTVLAVMTAGLYYSMSKGITLPLIAGYRSAIIALGIIGIGMCALSGGNTAPSGPFIILASVGGIVALILIVYGLITGTKFAFILLTVTILVLWAGATLRHLLSS